MSLGTVTDRARGAGPAGATDADNEVVEPWEMREWFAEYLDACNRHDLDAIRSFVEPSTSRS